MEEIRHMPGYTSILKAVLKSQIQHLVDQLAKETQEESLVVTACLDDGTFSHLGSKSGKDFLHDNTEMKTNFLGFCIKRKYRPKSPLILDVDYPPAQSPHPVTLCKVSGKGVVPLEQQKWPYHRHQNSPGKSKISARQRHVPYTAKGKQKAQTCSYQEQSRMSSSESMEDYSIDYVKDNDSNAASLEKEDGEVSIKIERFDDSDEQLDEDTAVDSESDESYKFPAPRNKATSASATGPVFESESVSGPSKDLSPISGGTKSSVEKHIATKTVSLPPSLEIVSPSQESCSLVNQGSNLSIKLETSFDLYNQEGSETTASGLGHTETKNTKVQLATHESQSSEEKKTKETGTNPEEYLFCKKKKLSQTGYISQLDKELLEEKKYVSETRHENSMYVENEVDHPQISDSDQPSQNRNSAASKQPTFIARNESDKEKLVNEMRSLNTIKKNESAIRQFQRWLLIAPRHIKTDILKIPVDQLDSYIGTFLLSIRKSDGSDYEPETLTSYHRGIHRYLREKKYPFSMVHDREFTTSRAVLAAKRKALRRIGKGGRPNAPKPLTTDMQTVLKEKKCIGFETPQQLINQMWLNNTMLFGIRGGTEHHNLRWGDFALKLDADGISYLEFNGRYTKTKNNSSQLAFKSKQYSHENPENCPIHSYKEFMRRRPTDSFTPDSPFYLAINHNRRWNSDDWYKNQPLGEKSLRGKARKMTEEASLPDNKIIQ